MSGERLNNAVQFKSATFGGFTGGVMYAFGQNSGNLSTNLGRAISANVQYAYDGFSAGAVLTDINPGARLCRSDGRSDGAGPSRHTDHHAGRRQPAHPRHRRELRIRSVECRCALHEHSSETRRPHRDRPVLHLGGDWHVRPDVVFAGKVSFDRFEASRWYTATVGFDYLLSKRTDVYIDLDAQKASGPGTVASIALTAPSSTDHQFVSRVGIRHLF